MEREGKMSIYHAEGILRVNECFIFMWSRFYTLTFDVCTSAGPLFFITYLSPSHSINVLLIVIYYLRNVFSLLVVNFTVFLFLFSPNEMLL